MTRTNEALDALRVELKQNTIEPDMVDYVVERTLEVVGETQRTRIVTLGGSSRLAATWGTAALFYIDASVRAGASGADTAYELAVLAAREAREFFAHLDHAGERRGNGPYALTAGQLAAHLAQARAALAWLKERKQAENRPLDTSLTT